MHDSDDLHGVAFDQIDNTVIAENELSDFLVIEFRNDSSYVRKRCELLDGLDKAIDEVDSM